MKNIISKRKIIVGILILLFSLGAVSVNASISYAAESSKGIALKSPTKVYVSTSSKSTVLKSYKQGTILKYSSHSNSWFSMTVSVNGKNKKGFVKKTDVENLDKTQKNHTGIALKTSTAFYSTPSTDSKKLTTYSGGTILKYKTFSKNWNTAKVKIKGKEVTGYILKKDFENRYDQQKSMKAISVKASTPVYTKASTSSKSLKSYSEGSVLKYKTFSKNWHEITFSLKGKTTKGYIHTSHVENVVASQKSLKGIGLKNPTTIYSSASTNSKKLKTYAQGTVLSYKTFTSKWNEMSVKINGKNTTGYIHKSHLEGLSTSSNSINGVAMKNPTKVYALASKNAKVLTNYSKPDHLALKSLSPNWLTVKVRVSGKDVTGYVHNGDISKDRILIKSSSYKTDFKKMIDLQLALSAPPQISGKTGGWINASRKQVEYYSNPSNFKKNTTNYYQFLVLSKPAGLHAKEVNQKILSSKGVLTGKAQTFINAGKKYGVNEAYLIAHALLETGNGSSTLAKGIPVNKKGEIVSEKIADYKVYNMYGIGATDKCPESCGAKKAFQEGWFTPEAAIVGGADFIHDYIARGQDTLYKMRWNPIKPGSNQYATDTAWAVKQTARIEQLYKLVDNFVLIYDVPKYGNQPSVSGDPNAYITIPPVSYPSGIYGVNTANMELNLREKPTTKNSKIIKKIPNKAEFEVLQKDGNWYKVKYKGSTGWASADYVDVLNLLEARTNSLNIRSKASTAKDSLIFGKVNKGALLAGQLDSKNKLIKSNEWYKITYSGKTAWVSSSKNGSYISVKY